jgi:hypothetical protein
MKIILFLSLTLLTTGFFMSSSARAQNAPSAVYGILIDNTGTLRLQLDDARAVGNAVVQKTSDRGVISIFNFKTEMVDKYPFAVPNGGTKWSQDKKELEKNIAEINTTVGQTQLFDAIYAVAKSVAAKAESDKISEKIVVLITDGEDRASEISEGKLFKELKASGVKIYVVGLVSSLDSSAVIGGNNSYRKAKLFLKKLASETGGNAIFPKLKKKTKVEDVITELFANEKN